MNFQQTTPPPKRQVAPSFGTAFRFWLKLGFISFGGPTGQIAIMQTELVEKKRWISQSRFLHALNFCMLLPGPEAQQLAIYVGWLLHKTWGGIVVICDRRRCGITAAYATEFGACVSGLGSLADAMADADIDHRCAARLGKHAL